MECKHPASCTAGGALTLASARVIISTEIQMPVANWLRRTPARTTHCDALRRSWKRCHGVPRRATVGERGGVERRVAAKSLSSPWCPWFRSEKVSQKGVVRWGAVLKQSRRRARLQPFVRTSRSVRHRATADKKEAHVDVGVVERLVTVTTSLKSILEFPVASPTVSTWVGCAWLRTA